MKEPLPSRDEQRHTAWSHASIAAAATLILIAFEGFAFTKYYEGFWIFAQLQAGILLKPLKTVVLGVPSYFVSALFIYAALISGYRSRLVYFAIFTFGSLVGYSYQANFARFSVSEDLANILFSADGRIVVNSAIQYFNVLSLVPCAGFVLLLVIVKPAARNTQRLQGIAIATAIGFYLCTSYFSTNSYPTTAFASFYRTSIAFPTNWYLGSLTMPSLASFYNQPRESLAPVAHERPANNIVFIVDESMRGDHLSINGYSRKTTPFLEELAHKGFLTNWGIAASGTTCSTTSNNLMLTGVKDLPDVSGKVYRYPTIFQYAKAMGYSTHYIDGQMTYRWLGKSKDVADFGEWIKADDLNHEHLFDIDGEIGRRVHEIVENSTGNFIWINKFGVHPPYFDSYPAEETNWQPVSGRVNALGLVNLDDIKVGVVNNYDSAILYNSEHFFRSLIADGPAANTYYVYTSDHGQNLGEEGRTLSHCSTTPYEAIVPLFMITRPGALPAADTDFKASHANLFATLLDLMNFPDDNRDIYAISLFKAHAADSKKRYFFEGNLTSRFGNSTNLFDR